MKKAFTLLTFIFLSLTALAEEIEVEGIMYNIEGNEASVIHQNYPKTYSGDIVIPASIAIAGAEYPVTSIGKQAFNGCNSLTSITVPNSVMSIGSHAFSYCSKLTSVTIPNSVTSISEYTFACCWELKSITIPKSVTTIAEKAFWSCSKLTSITIPESVTNIGEDAFLGTNLTSVNIEKLEAWCNIKFEGKYSNPCIYAHKFILNDQEVTDLEIPNTVTSVSEYAFYGCSELTSVNIPASVTFIGKDAFYDCDGVKKAEFASIEALCRIKFDSYTATPLRLGRHLYVDGKEVTDVVIPETITEIGDYTFYNCNYLTSVSIPNSVKSIGTLAFHSCSKLSSIVFPPSVTSIGNNAFSKCSGLTSVTLPYGLTSIGQSAFSSCPNLEDVYCYAVNPPTGTYIFDRRKMEYAILYVPEESIDRYEYSDEWNCFGKIVAIGSPNSERCSKPTISFTDGKLVFYSDTDGADIMSKIEVPDMNDYTGNEIELSATYNITAYAYKTGMLNSSVANATLVWLNTSNDGDNDGVENITVPSIPVLINCNEGMLNITGVKIGSIISIYSSTGQLTLTTTASSTTITVDATSLRNTIAIIKIDNKSIKFQVK